MYLGNGLHKAKIKSSDTVFQASRNHQGEVVVVAGVCLLPLYMLGTVDVERKFGRMLCRICTVCASIG